MKLVDDAIEILSDAKQPLANAFLRLNLLPISFRIKILQSGLRMKYRGMQTKIIFLIVAPHI